MQNASPGWGGYFITFRFYCTSIFILFAKYIILFKDHKKKIFTLISKHYLFLVIEIMYALFI